MNLRKVWAITGAGDGLGPATVKYLTSRQQRVIALVEDQAKCRNIAAKDSLYLRIISPGTPGRKAFRRELIESIEAFGALDLR